MMISGKCRNFFYESKNRFLVLTKKIQNFPYAANYVNLYNKHLYIFFYYIYVTTLQISLSIVKSSCIDHFFYFSRLEFLVCNHVTRWQIFFEEFIWKWVLVRVPRGEKCFCSFSDHQHGRHCLVSNREVLGRSPFFMG